MSRDALDVFSHLSDSDKSLLLEYPLHRVDQLLTRDKGEGGNQLQPEIPLEEDIEELSTMEDYMRGEDDDENEETECTAAKRRRIEEEPVVSSALTNEDEV